MTIPLFKVFMADTAAKETGEILKSGYIGQGPKVDEFERLLKQHFNNDYVVTVNSGTSALQLAVHLIKPENGFSDSDEIIVTPLTCFASVSAIIANGCKVRWADVDPKTCNIDLVDVERKLGPNTRAVMVVHWGGTPVDIDELSRIKKRYKETYQRDLHIIEDCAHCWDSKYKNQLIGNSGNFCCFSFQAIKFLTTGDGGMLITPDASLYKRAKNLRWFGLDRDSGASFRCIQDIEESGFKYHLHDIGATIGIENLSHMSEVVSKHKSNASFFNKNLSSVYGVTLLEESRHSESSYWLFTMFVERRAEFIFKMESKGIMCSPVHARCDKHSCVSDFKSFLPSMDSLQTRHVSIPCGWWVGDKDRNYIIDCIKEGW